MRKETNKETDTEMLARLMVNGFEQVRSELKKEISSVKEEMNARFASVDARFASVDARFDSVDARFASVDSRLANIETEQRETNRRLSSLEKKQMGTILSLDETVHRSEFDKVVKRVEVLENR